MAKHRITKRPKRGTAASRKLLRNRKVRRGSRAWAAYVKPSTVKRLKAARKHRGTGGWNPRWGTNKFKCSVCGKSPAFSGAGTYSGYRCFNHRNQIAYRLNLAAHKKHGLCPTANRSGHGAQFCTLKAGHREDHNFYEPYWD